MTGYALLVGLKEVSWDNTLTRGCLGAENDVDAMAAMLRDKGFNSIQSLKTSEATKQNFVNSIDALNRILDNTLNSNDIFVFYFSGHGIQKDDPMHTVALYTTEALCFYDQIIRDFEIQELFTPLFQKDIRIVMITDCCHSATNHKSNDINPLDIQAQSIHIGACKDDATVNGAANSNQCSPFTQKLLNTTLQYKDFEIVDFSTNVIDTFRQQDIFTV